MSCYGLPGLAGRNWLAGWVERAEEFAEPEGRAVPPRPDGLAPDGLAPDGLAPDGLAPDGLAPDGLAGAEFAGLDRCVADRRPEAAVADG